jgi:hypothetical protein
MRGALRVRDYSDLATETTLYALGRWPVLRVAGVILVLYGGGPRARRRRREPVDESVDPAQCGPSHSLSNRGAKYAARHGPEEGAQERDRHKHRADLRAGDNPGSQARQSTHVLISLAIFVLHMSTPLLEISKATPDRYRVRTGVYYIRLPAPESSRCTSWLSTCRIKKRKRVQGTPPKPRQ